MVRDNEGTPYLEIKFLLKNSLVVPEEVLKGWILGWLRDSGAPKPDFFDLPHRGWPGPFAFLLSDMGKAFLYALEIGDWEFGQDGGLVGLDEAVTFAEKMGDFLKSLEKIVEDLGIWVAKFADKGAEAEFLVEAPASPHNSGRIEEEPFEEIEPQHPP